MRRSPLLLALAAAACGDGAVPQPADDKIDCALAGSPGFDRICRVERTAGAQGLILTLRAPDGGFRRLLVTSDGRGVVSADGAEPARVTVLGAGAIEVAIGTDRYRLPAKVQ
jgi:hypothetical protein